jgi:hypothetical protein
MRTALTPHALTPRALIHVQFVLLASLWWPGQEAGGPPTQAAAAGQAGTDPVMTSQVVREPETRGCSGGSRTPRAAGPGGSGSPQPGQAC